MKKISILALTLVLTAALFTGCGCTNRNQGTVTTPTVMPTVAPTAAPTEHTTVPTTHATEPSTHETIDYGNGPLEETIGNGTHATENTVEGNARTVHPNNGR